MKKKMHLQWAGWMAVLLLLAFGRVNGQGSSLSFEQVRHAFGDVKEEGGAVTHIFTCTNTGKSPLRILNVKTTCGCTVSEWTRDSILPGGRGQVALSFHPASRPGIFDKEAFVTTDGRPETITLQISGKVIPRPKGPQDYYPFEEGVLRFQTNHLTYGRVHKDESVTLSTIVYNQGSKPLRFIPAKSRVPGHLKPTLSKLEMKPGDTATISITYNAALKDDYGFAFDALMLATTDPSHPLTKINVSAILLERFPKTGPEADKPPRIKIDRTEVDLGSVEEGQFPEATFTITNTGGHPLKLRKVSSGCTCLIPAVPRTVIPPGESTTILAKFNTRGRIGMQEKEVTLICNDPSNVEHTLRVTADVKRVPGTEGK